MTFIKNEIKYIIDKLSSNPNKNILYHSKYTKFTIDKYDNSVLKNDVNIFPSNNINIIIKNDITNKWLVNKGENCRYCSFITIYYFVFLSYISNQNGEEFKKLKELNQLVLNLNENVKDENLNKIILFFQINKFDIDNKLLDLIQNEKDDNIKNNLLQTLKKNSNINYFTSGYITGLFNIFKNIKNFCIQETKKEECILC